MKRYITGEIYWARQNGEDPATEYYRRADLIAAGVLVPVPDGEACYPGYTQAINCTYDGKLCSITGKCGGFVWLRPIDSNDGGDFSISTSDIIQPVRLVKLEDAE